MVEKYEKGEGIDVITTEDGLKFDNYYSIVTEDAFDRYAHFIYLVIKRINEPERIRRNAYLVPFMLLDEFFNTVHIPGEKLVHIEPMTVEMVAAIREELRQDHTPAEG